MIRATVADKCQKDRRLCLGDAVRYGIKFTAKQQGASGPDVKEEAQLAICPGNSCDHSMTVPRAGERGRPTWAKVAWPQGMIGRRQRRRKGSTQAPRS